MEKIKRKSRILKFRIKFILSFILMSLVIFSIYLISNSLLPKKEKIDFVYNTNSDIKYKVFLKENNFYEENFLNEGKQYPAELIDYIDIDFSYLLNSSKLLDYDYSYNVVGTIIGEYENTSSGKSEIWKKRYPLLDAKKEELKRNTILNLNQNIKIKYSDYSRVVNDFKSKFRLAIEAYLNVKLEITYKGKENEETLLNNTDNLEVNIPLTSSTIVLSKICQKDPTCPKKASINVPKKTNEKENKKSLYSGICLLFSSVILSFMFLPSILKTKNRDYIKKVSKILKNYSEIIIEVETLPDFGDLELINVKSFDDMVDIEEEIKSPIIFFEVEENKESWFIITSDKYVYRYILDNE